MFLAIKKMFNSAVFKMPECICPCSVWLLHPGQDLGDSFKLVENKTTGIASHVSIKDHFFIQLVHEFRCLLWIIHHGGHWLCVVFLGKTWRVVGLNWQTWIYKKLSLWDCGKNQNTWCLDGHILWSYLLGTISDGYSRNLGYLDLLWIVLGLVVLSSDFLWTLNLVNRINY
jgi:hypothetical protein